jgi:uncharacterized protein YqeY
MTLKERIDSDLKAALLGGDRFKSETLRGLKAAILNEEVAQNKRAEGLGDLVNEQVVARELKKRNESATVYEQNGRADMAADERREAEILAVYLPDQLGDEELNVVIEATVQQLGANGMGDMGKVIGTVKSKVGNTADGAKIAELVKKALQ